MVVPETLQTLNLCNKTLQTVEQEAYIVLRELFCIAGGDIRSHLRLSPRDFIISSTQMALCLLSIIFGIPIAKPKPFGTCDLWRLQRNLSRSTVRPWFEYGTYDDINHPKIRRMGRAPCKVPPRWARRSYLEFGVSITKSIPTLHVSRLGTIHVSHLPPNGGISLTCIVPR